ncbi:MAG: hypothetical protein WBQ65_20415 [Bryobacteraceae bacterium]
MAGWRIGPRDVRQFLLELRRVVFYFTDENVRETSPGGKAVVAPHKAGDFIWGGPARYRVEYLNDKPLEALVVEVGN